MGVCMLGDDTPVLTVSCLEILPCTYCVSIYASSLRFLSAFRFLRVMLGASPWDMPRYFLDRVTLRDKVRYPARACASFSCNVDVEGRDNDNTIDTGTCIRYLDICFIPLLNLNTDNR